MKTTYFSWWCLGLSLFVLSGRAQTNPPVAVTPQPASSYAAPPLNPLPPSPPLIIEAPPAPESPVPATPSPAAQTNAPIDVEATSPARVIAPTNAPAPVLAPVDLGADKGAAAEAEELIPSLAYREANLYPVIEDLARQAKINILFDPRLTATRLTDGESIPILAGTNGVELKATVRLENVTARQALEAILSINNLALVPDPKTRIARITIKDTTAPEPLVTKVVQLQYSNPTNIMAIIKPMFPPPSRNQVIPDTRTSQLVVLATERDMEAIEALIRKLDTPTRQVLIEARLLETSQNPTSIKGIDWSGTLQGQRVSLGNGLMSGSSSFTKVSPGTPVTTTLPSGRTITTTPESSSQSTLNTVTTFGAGEGSTIGPGGLSLNTANGFSPNMAFLSADGVSAVLSFLNQDADTEVVATPRAVTLDNETATLSVTRAYPIFQVTPGSANSPAGAQTIYTNVGTILTVTPRISGSNNIALRVVPEVSSIAGQDQQTVGGLINRANIYASRKIETHVVIPSGNTLVMGGLISDSTTKSYAKVPILGDLPVLGLLFRRDTKDRLKQNLLIFITPTIIQDSDFQLLPASSFLQAKPKDSIQEPITAWDSGQPYNWKKSSNEKR